MKILISEKFKKSVPNEKKDVVIEKIKQLGAEIKRLEDSNLGIRDISKGFSIWKIKNAKEEIYKFRVDQSNRIIFTLTKCFKNWKRGDFEDENNIHILRYCTHDEQILRAKNISLDELGFIDLEDTDFYKEIEEELYDPYDEYYNTYYDSSKDKISIYNDKDLEKIFGLNSREDIYKLNEQQTNVLNSECPIFLFGSAGSGKTTIAVRKIKNIADLNNNLRIGYFTFSKKLERETEEIFECLEKNNKCKTNSKIEFYSIDEFLEKETRNDEPCKYEGFEHWVYENNIKKHMKIEEYDLFDLYREIRGIIKGMIGIEWCKENPNLYKRVLMDKKEYLNIKPEYSSYEDKENAYELARRYQKWLDKEGIKDDNDLAVEVIEKIEKGITKKFDFIVVDEIQDLTEKQIYMIYKLVKTPQNVFLAGDYHQTVNATYFNTHRIKSLFKINEEEFKEYKLSLNYRSQREIVELAKEVSKLRIEKLYKDESDYEEKYLENDSKDNFKPILLKKNKKNKEMLLKIANKRHYAAIIVPDDVEKQNLIDVLDEDGIIDSNILKDNDNKGKISKVMTISEAKGIEKQVVICYNIISRNKKIWREIINLKDKREGFEKQFLYRSYFNKLYVAITRARKQICFYEDENVEFFINELSNKIDTMDEFNENRLNLNVKSKSEDHLNAAFDYEEINNYESAIFEYIQSEYIYKDAYVKRCRAKILKNKKKRKKDIIKAFNSAGNEFFKNEMFKEAIDCYIESGNKICKIKCMIAIKRDLEKIEKIINEENINIFDAIFNLHGVDEDINNKIICYFLDLCNEMIYRKIDEKIDKLHRIEKVF